MAKLPCRELKCTQCCQWGKEGKMLRPDPKLTWKSTGDCQYLDRKTGCVVHGTALFPEACAKFDCRNVFKQMPYSPVIQVLRASFKLEAYLERRENEDL